MAKAKKMAVEIVSDIGQKAYQLQFHGDKEIEDAVAFLRKVNPEPGIFDWLVKILARRESAGTGE